MIIYSKVKRQSRSDGSCLGLQILLKSLIPGKGIQVQKKKQTRLSHFMAYQMLQILYRQM